MIDIQEVEDKPSVCYGCGQKLKKHSLLICAECLDDECDEFESLVNKDLEVPLEE